MTQFKDVLNVETDTDSYTLVGRPCELSAFSFVPKERNVQKERTVFNSEKKERYSSSNYDRLFHLDYGYNNKLHRCDREHDKLRGLHVNDEEKLKAVPTLSSTVYGQRLDNNLDPRDRKHVRIAHVQTEFYRRTGINIEAKMEYGL
ncbi:hypothetical protein LSH36_270g03060 [Paralvinella palmiformis]|uniref:Uncharacterized protein n=1 Tax=Paralvinella palmiformis TaxID=53620 RepID=A0AAD9N452_9ANNE|nr:hypothetical protein LSH36_270g03060 [Paralvinella palmiformis]